MSHICYIRLATGLPGWQIYTSIHDDVIKWKYFPRYWPFVRGIHLSPVNSPHKGQWHGGLMFSLHNDVIKWKYFPRYWPVVRGIHRSPVNSPHKGQWRGALKFSLICAWTHGWVNNRKAGDLRRHRAHYDVIVIRCTDSSYPGGNTRRTTTKNVVGKTTLLQLMAMCIAKYIVIICLWDIQKWNVILPITVSLLFNYLSYTFSGKTKRMIL